jgi:alpha-tubulin suppressor-like RCC1 family protein
MSNDFILWGNGDHEFSLNNPNPKSKRFYYNKKEFSTIDTQQLKKIDSVFCKDNCLLIISEGELYRKGLFNFEIDDFENEKFKKIKNNQVDMEKIDEFDKKSNPNGILDIQFGSNHILILNGDGKVYSWGDNYYGQLGINNYMIPVQKKPTKINFPDDIKISKICAYKNNSFAIDYNQNLWGWGKYEYIKLDDARNIYTPMRILKEDKKVVKLNVMDGRFIVEVEVSNKSNDNQPQTGDNNDKTLNNSINTSKLELDNHMVKAEHLNKDKKSNIEYYFISYFI